MLFTGLGRSVWEKLCPWSWVRPSAFGLGPYSRPRAQFFPIRPSRPVNNIYALITDFWLELHNELELDILNFTLYSIFFTVLVNCPLGYFFNSSGCQACVKDHYQDQEAQNECVACPTGTSTFGQTGSKGSKDCKGQLKLFVCSPVRCILTKTMFQFSHIILEQPPMVFLF